MKSEAEVPVQPPELVIEMADVLAVPEGTLTVISESLMIVNVALVPLKSNEVASVKLLPVIVISVFSGPLSGEKDVTIGAGHKFDTVVV